jgi:hypothetical protein
MKVTPDIAREWLAYPLMPGQRPLRDQHLKRLYDKMKAGEFITGHIAFADNDLGKTSRVMPNGQHQCHCIIRARVTIPALVQEFYYDSPEALADLFRQFDSHAFRSQADMVRVEVDARGLDWPPSMANLLVGAIAMCKGFLYNCHREDRIEQLAYHTEFGEWVVNRLFERKKSKYPWLAKRSIVAAMLQTYESDLEAAGEFWVQVRDGELMRKDDPAFVLRNWLMSVSSPQSKAPRYKVASDKEMRVKCIRAWNAFRMGSKPSYFVYYPDKPIPKAK